jgi:HAE1 family hydrophobic/amphiphilic exporter-1
MEARDLTALAEDVIARRLLAIQGVGRASVRGGHAAADRLSCSTPDRMKAFGVAWGRSQGRCWPRTATKPAGEIDTGAHRSDRDGRGARGPGRRLPGASGVVGGRPARHPGRCGDDPNGEGTATSLALLGRGAALAIDVVKQQGANTVEIAEDIRAAVEELNAEDMPEGVRIDIVGDNAVEVEEATPPFRPC